MSLLKKSIYDLVCKGAKSGKEAWEMLQEYISDMVYMKVENTPYEDDYYIIVDNIFHNSENIKARNLKEVDEIIDTLIENELSKNAVI